MFTNEKIYVSDSDDEFELSQFKTPVSIRPRMVREGAGFQEEEIELSGTESMDEDLEKIDRLSKSLFKPIAKRPLISDDEEEEEPPKKKKKSTKPAEVNYDWTDRGNPIGTARWWVGTRHNWTAEIKAYFQNLEGTRDDVRFLGFAEEQGSAGETPHLQFFVGFTEAKRFAGVKKIFEGAHLQMMKGSFGQNMKYISKEDVPRHIYGTPPMTKTIQGMAKVARMRKALTLERARVDRLEEFVYMSEAEYQRSSFHLL